MLHYKQRSSYDCFLASICTILQEDVYDKWPVSFVEDIEAKKGTHGPVIDKAFGFLGLVRDRDYWCQYIPETMSGSPIIMNLLMGRRVIVQTPSLNHEGSYHVVPVINGKVLDPSNLQVYRWVRQLSPAYVWLFNEVKETPDLRSALIAQ